MSYKLKIDYVADFAEELDAFFDSGEMAGVIVKDTGQRPNGNFELLLESQSLTDMYDFLLANYLADNDKEQALYHMTLIEK